VGAEIFRTCSNRFWCPSSLLYNGYRVSPGGKKLPGRNAEPSPPSSVVVHERVEPYGLYRASVPVRYLICVAHGHTIPNYAESRHITAVEVLSEVSKVATKFYFSYFRRVSNSFIKDTHTHTHTKSVPNE
jgi:hypothetical protein